MSYLEVSENRSRSAVVLTVRVQPRASRDEVSGAMQGALKIRLCAPAKIVPKNPERRARANQTRGNCRGDARTGSESASDGNVSHVSFAWGFSTPAEPDNGHAKADDQHSDPAFAGDSLLQKKAGT